MKTTQIYEFLSTVYSEVTGQSSIVNENLSNIVDVGSKLLSTDYREKYVNSLLNRIGRMVFVERPYKGMVPSLIRESWEWGSIMSKSRTKDFSPTTNPTWDLTPGESVDPYLYNPPEVQTTLYNTMVTWEIDCSFVNRILKQSFMNAGEMDRFLSMIRSRIDNDQNQYLEALTMRTINSFIARRINKGIAIVDLLASYNSAFGATLTADKAFTNKDFLRHVAYIILLYKDRLKAKTAVFSENATGYTTFTPAEYCRLVLLSDLAKGLDVYLQSETFHNELTEIGAYDTVPFFQGSGTAFDTLDITHLNVTLPGITPETTVNRTGIVGVMFDRDAMGIINEDKRIEVAYNPRGEYWNNFYKVDTRLFNDPAENGIIFTVGTGSITPPTPPAEEN